MLSAIASFFEYIIVIILLIAVLAMRGSEKRWIAFIGWGVFLLPKIIRALQ